MASSAPILDLYAYISHKEALTEANGRGRLAPTWVPEDDHRRLTAYKILAAYTRNVAREFLPSDTPDATRKKRREYGDADLLVDRIRAGVLGEDPEIVVAGADVDIPDEPDLPPEPKEPGEGATDVQRRIFQARQARWEADVTQALEDWEKAWAELPGLLERQEWLRQWADDEGFWPKLHEGEGDTCELGDGVYTLTWSKARKRPVLRVYDPGFYFPVIDERAQDEGFPRRVHIAWEFEDKDKKKHVRRLTWDLVDLPEGETRAYPWSTEPSTQTCLFSDGTWAAESDGMKDGLYDFTESAAKWAMTEDGVPALRVDLQQDWLPVVHVPDTPASRDFFGRSVLLVIAQLLDDIHMSDTDVQAAASLAAGPVIALAGGDPEKKVRVRPGMVWGIDVNGRMDVLDLTAGLKELRDTNESLRDMLSINGRVPNAVLGRVDLTGNLAGVTLALSFSPFTQLIGALRMTREAKYQLLLKMVQRLAQAAGEEAGGLRRGENPVARVAFGPFLPSDRDAVIEAVTKALQAGAISTQTAVQILVASAGYPIDDARAEVQRIRYENPASARDLADATGSEQLAAEYLGVELPTDEQEEPAGAEPPVPQLPDQPEPAAPPAEET